MTAPLVVLLFAPLASLLVPAVESSPSRLFPITLGSSGMLESHHQDSAAGSDSSSSRNPEESSSNEETIANGTMRCDDARLRCAYRTGCGRALQHYLTKCDAVLRGDVQECPEICQHALIALTSTDEGKDLMKCACADNDRLCQVSKQRAEICRPSVTITMNRTRVSCRVATWICNADATCSTALQYYNENCKRMFHGKKCTKRCRNSLNILRRQEKAAKLNTCFCDGAEEFECKSIHRNMNQLCYGGKVIHREYQQEPDDEAGGPGGTGGRSPKGSPEQDCSSPGASPVGKSWTILISCLVLLLQLRIKPSE